MTKHPGTLDLFQEFLNTQSSPAFLTKLTFTTQIWLVCAHIAMFDQIRYYDTMTNAVEIALFRKANSALAVFAAPCGFDTHVHITHP